MRAIDAAVRPSAPLSPVAVDAFTATTAAASGASSTALPSAPPALTVQRSLSSAGSASAAAALLSGAHTELELGPSDAFVRLYGAPHRHGYAWKRGDTWKTWKFRYFYLVENRLLYFPENGGRGEAQLPW